MKSMTAAVSRSLFFQILLLVILTDVSVLLNVPLLRQFSGFLFLTLVPGYLILQMLKLNKLGLVEKFVLSVGLSIAFDMLFGLMFNFLVLATGYTRPLSTGPILISFSAAALGLAALAARLNEDSAFSLPTINFSVKEKTLLILPALFPLMSIVGSRVLNLSGDSALIVLLLLLIPTYVIFISVQRGNAYERIYPPILLLTGISLVLLQALRSNHIVGSDVHQMYGAFQNTLDKLNYSITTPSLVDSLASTTVLPAVYQALLRIDPEYLFKLLIPILSSISPVAIFVIARKYIGNYYAFISAFMLMSQIIFFRATDFASTSLAILFFALAVMALYLDGISEVSRKLFFLLFAVSTILSHYSTSLIFFFILLLTWISAQIINWAYQRWNERQSNLKKTPPVSAPDGQQPTEGKTVSSVVFMLTRTSGAAILLFFVVFFLWHSQITRYAFDTIVQVIQRAFRSLYQSFESESTNVLAAATGRMVTPAIWKAIRWAVYWLEIIFIAVGGLSIAVRRKNAVTYPGSKNAVAMNPLKTKIDPEYVLFSAAGVIVLTTAVILPYLSVAYTLWRSYYQLMVFLSVFFPIGAFLIAARLRLSPRLLMLLVLIPYFLFSAGIVEYWYGIRNEIWLGNSGPAYDSWYVHDEDSYSAEWVGEHRQENVRVYGAGVNGALVLVSQGKIPYLEVINRTLERYRAWERDSYIFLRKADTIVGRNLERYPAIFSAKSRIYDAGGAEVYK